MARGRKSYAEKVDLAASGVDLNALKSNLTREGQIALAQTLLKNARDQRSADKGAYEERSKKITEACETFQSALTEAISGSGIDKVSFRIKSDGTVKWDVLLTNKQRFTAKGTVSTEAVAETPAEESGNGAVSEETQGESVSEEAPAAEAAPVANGEQKDNWD